MRCYCLVPLLARGGGPDDDEHQQQPLLSTTAAAPAPAKAVDHDVSLEGTIPLVTTGGAVVGRKDILHALQHQSNAADVPSKQAQYENNNETPIQHQPCWKWAMRLLSRKLIRVVEIEEKESDKQAAVDNSTSATAAISLVFKEDKYTTNGFVQILSAGDNQSSTDQYRRIIIIGGKVGDNNSTTTTEDKDGIRWMGPYMLHAGDILQFHCPEGEIPEGADLPPPLEFQLLLCSRRCLPPEPTPKEEAPNDDVAATAMMNPGDGECQQKEHTVTHNDDDKGIETSENRNGSCAFPSSQEHLRILRLQRFEPASSSAEKDAIAEYNKKNHDVATPQGNHDRSPARSKSKSLAQQEGQATLPQTKKNLKKRPREEDATAASSPTTTLDHSEIRNLVTVQYLFGTIDPDTEPTTITDQVTSGALPNGEWIHCSLKNRPFDGDISAIDLSDSEMNRHGNLQSAWQAHVAKLEGMDAINGNNKRRSRKPTRYDAAQIIIRSKVLSGKWMLNVPPFHVGRVWFDLQRLMVQGQLGPQCYSMKVAAVPREHRKGHARYLICVYIEDFTNKTSVDACLKGIRSIYTNEWNGEVYPIERRLYFKPDGMTICDIYSNNPGKMPISFYSHNTEKDDENVSVCLYDK